MKKNFSIRSMLLVSTLSVLLGLLLSLHLGWLPSSSAQADTSAPAPARAVPPVGAPLSFSGLAKQVQTAVVNISTSKLMRTRRVDPYNFYGDIYGFFENQPARKQNSLGSGFILNKDGYILTNNHVVSGADQIQVKLSDGQIFNARLVGADPKIDVAVIKISAKESLPTVSLGNSDRLEIGDWVLAIGNPFGLTQTLTAGIVSAKGRIIGAGPYDNFIQTDASINPGNSGGPLFNLNGEVVGINTAIVSTGQGIGFAIPINMVKGIIPQLINSGRVQRGYLGIGLQEITPEVASSLGLARPQGALVAQVFDRSPAAQAGIVPGDLILNFNGRSIDNPHDLPVWVAQSEVGSTAEVEILRGRDKMHMKVKLASLEQMNEANAKSNAISDNGPLGLAVRDVNPEESRRNEIPPGKGVTVTDIERGSAADYVGIQLGDVVLEVNNRPITGVDSFKGEAQKLKRGEIAKIFVKRGPMTSFFAFKL